MSKIRVAVVGAGQFGRNHIRVIQQAGRAELAAIVDTDSTRACEAAAPCGCEAFADVAQIIGRVDAAVIATPTSMHVDAALPLLEAGIDVLVEKPIAKDAAAARRLIEAASRNGRILQVGHLERFNPAVLALSGKVRMPLFFEVHRLSQFTPRSLDIDVVLDLMIHDIDVVLSFVGAMPDEIRAAGISILTPKVDIANVRLSFPTGCIANLTASRVSTERVRKLRLFQPNEYLSVDYSRKEAFSLSVAPDRRIVSEALAVEKNEPLRLELDSFFDCVETRCPPRVGGEEAVRALEVALSILAKIEEHSKVVAQAMASAQKG